VPPLRTLALVAPALLGSALLAGCPGRGVPAFGAGGAADSLYLGVAASRTASGTAFFQGVQLAIDDLNAGRPSGAPPFALRLPPDSQTSQVAVAAAFRDDPSVVGVVGHTGSAQTMDAAPVYGDVEHGGKRGVVAITPTATNPAVARASEWVFRVCPTDEDGATALARFAVDSLRARRVAIVYRNDLFGRGFTRFITPQLEARGAKVLERDPYLAGATTYEAYAERIVRGGADALVIAGGAADAADVVRAVRRAGGRPAVLGTDDVAGIGTDLAAAEEFRGVRYSSFFLAERARTGAAAAFVESFRRRFDQVPNHRAALAYDAATLLGRAALATGGDRRRMRDWLAGVGRERPAHEGVSGPIAFDESGGAVGKPVLIGEVRP
jgi:branched-chain amino acid transport system substrate-binding protein